MGIICPSPPPVEIGSSQKSGGGHDPPRLRQPWLLYTTGGRLAFTSFISSSEMTMLTPLGLLNRTPKKGKIWVDNMVAAGCGVSTLLWKKSKQFRIPKWIFSKNSDRNSKIFVSTQMDRPWIVVPNSGNFKLSLDSKGMIVKVLLHIYNFLAKIQDLSIWGNSVA